MTKANKPQTYAELQAELDSVLARLQQDELDVEAAVALYQQGIALTNELEALLKTAENNVQRIIAAANDA